MRIRKQDKIQEVTRNFKYAGLEVEILYSQLQVIEEELESWEIFQAPSSLIKK